MKGEIQELLSVWRCILRNLRPGIFRRADLEDGLHLSEFHPRMLTGKHLDDEAAKRPDISFCCIARLLDHLRSHPEDGTLQ